MQIHSATCLLAAQLSWLKSPSNSGEGGLSAALAHAHPPRGPRRKISKNKAAAFKGTRISLTYARRSLLYGCLMTPGLRMATFLNLRTDVSRKIRRGD
ncbi:hypothetical protein LshimejAT787_1600480 [Lyophyllum shimeji]|uniref:Uncharacterized protein n=1 Tax=Lyophyllum shimeji TaxID=47721 RepID=A0A9P3PYY2_LYOSH|nr:hypothetical protein LshimejAT787_1600480 [Lyophyllum shimeji]